MTLSFEVELTTNDELVFNVLPLGILFRYSSWNSGLKAEVYQDEQWIEESFDLGLPLLSMSIEDSSASKFNAFLDKIPISITNLVKPFTYCQVMMLQWVSKSNHAKELLDHSPVLFWLIICEAKEQSWEEAIIADLLKLPRKNIMNKLIGISSAWLVKIINKVVLNDANREEYLVLKRGLINSALLISFRHERWIPIQAIHAANKFPSLINSKVFRKRAFMDCKHLIDVNAMLSKCDIYWSDAVIMARLLRIEDAEMALNRCLSFEQVKAIHDRWTEKLIRSKNLFTQGGIQFPEPPIEGTNAIVPITSEYDLIAEGRLMHHCVASYVDAIEKGKSYIYRILHPERATLELILKGDRAYVRQIALAYNQKPSEMTVLAVNKWLNDYHRLP